jgi:hypothetical protein
MFRVITNRSENISPHVSPNFFGGPEALLFIFSSAAPQRTAYSEVTIRDSSRYKDRQSTLGWGDCRI